MCPWAYQTSKWIREVRVQNGLEIRWRFFSLEEINPGVFEEDRLMMEGSFVHGRPPCAMDRL